VVQKAKGRKKKENSVATCLLTGLVVIVALVRCRLHVQPACASIGHKMIVGSG
jgi:hypothetical protein